MAYNVNALADYVQQNGDVILKKVVFGGDTIDRMMKQTGVKESATLNILATTPTLQSGADCGFDAAGDAVFSQRTINAAPIKINMELCSKTLLGKWAEYQVRVAADEGSYGAPFEEEIIASIIDNKDKKVEKIVWQGDTASSDAELKLTNGLLKILAGESSVVAEAIAAGTSAYEAIKAVFVAVPAELLDRNDLRINVSPELYREFILEMVEKNFYHYAGPNAEFPKEFYLPGTNARVTLTNGLAGTNKIVAACDSNLYFGTDLENGSEIVDAFYSRDDRTFKIVIEWNMGVQVAFPDEVVVGTIAQ